MKKTLALGVSTAIVMTTLTGCVFDRPVTTKYGIDPPQNSQYEEPIPEVYGANPDTEYFEQDDNPDVSIPSVYGPSTDN